MQAILFDMDGTLVDSVGVLEQTYLSFLSQRGFMGTRAEFDELNGPSLKEIVAILASRYRLEEPVADLFAQYLDVLDSIYQSDAAPFAASTTAIDAARRCADKVALVTSTQRKLVDVVLAKFGWQNKFDLIVTGDEVRHSKPHPEIYSLAMQKLDIEDPQQVLVVEDALNGVKAAAAANLPVIAVNGRSDLRQALLDAGALNVLGDLSALPGEILRLNPVA